MRLLTLLILKNEEIHGTMNIGVSGAGSLVVVKNEPIVKPSSNISTTMRVAGQNLGGIA